MDRVYALLISLLLTLLLAVNYFYFYPNHKPIIPQDILTKEKINSHLSGKNNSQHFNCFSSKINPQSEVIILKNKCDPINLKNWVISDQTRKEYKLPNVIINKEIIIYSGFGNNSDREIYLNSKKDIWNNDGDILYLFDEKEELAYFEFYNS